jgi:hypothetical protein
MKRPRVRIGTLMLLVIIAALASALVIQHDRAARREAALRGELTKLAFRRFGDANLDDWVAAQRRIKSTVTTR